MRKLVWDKMEFKIKKNYYQNEGTVTYSVDVITRIKMDCWKRVKQFPAKQYD